MTRLFVSHPLNRFDPYFGQRALSALQAVAEVRCNPSAHELPVAQLIEAARDCDAIIAAAGTPGPELLFKACPRLAAFVRCGTDVRTVDLAAADAHGVLVTHASDDGIPAVAEWCIGAMLDLGRGTSYYAEAYHAGRVPLPFLGRQLRDSTLAVIGNGPVATHLGDLASALGMHVRIALHDRPDPASFPNLLAASDFVVCLAPAQSGTLHWFGAAAFAAMRPGSFFVNASRGELVDENALLEALNSGHLRGAAIDVGMTTYQLPTGTLARHPRVTATPRIGGFTQPAMEHQAMECVQQISALLRGDIPKGALNAAQARRVRQWPAFAACPNPGPAD
jgi:D-3-phosphoglycerate dehydrogenase